MRIKRTSVFVSAFLVVLMIVAILDRYVRRWYQTIMSAQYVSDETGRRTAVLLPIEDYERLMEDLEHLAAIAERRDEPTVSHEDLVAELKRDGLLPT